MIIQSYDVRATSQRTSLSVQSTTMLATKNLGTLALRGISISAQGSSLTASQSLAPQDTIQISDGKTKKPNNGLALGHYKQPNKGLAPGHLKQLQKGLKEDSLNLLAKNSKVKPQRASKPKKGGNKDIPKTPKELRDKLMELMFEILSGKGGTAPVNVPGGSSFSKSSVSFDMSYVSAYFGMSDGTQAAAGGPARAGWSVEQFQYESETVSYQAQGVINTADGRTLNVDISMYMSREYTSYMNIDVEVSRLLCDPLVINYGGTAASLMGETFSFDLTSDGNMESLAMLGSGSGFLALDKNGDGKINDGSELFGPNSGCGFSELREYDKDKNGWIDEADDVFGKLLVWTRDKDGNETSFTLKELGIGAIYLGDIATEFSFKDESNQTLGVMRSTSFFLKEDGGAGTVSHIDLAV